MKCINVQLSLTEFFWDLFSSMWFLAIDDFLWKNEGNLCNIVQYCAISHIVHSLYSLHYDERFCLLSYVWRKEKWWRSLWQSRRVPVVPGRHSRRSITETDLMQTSPECLRVARDWFLNVYCLSIKKHFRRRLKIHRNYIFEL